MTDPVTNNYSLVQPTVGGDTNTWGGILNAGTFAAADAALGSTLPVTVTTANVDLTTSQFQNAIFLVTGALTGDRVLSLPLSPNSATLAVGGRFVVINNTTGDYSLTVKTVAVGSTGVIVPRSFASFLYSDGTNVGYSNAGLPAYAAASNGDPNGQLAGTTGTVNTNASIAYDYTNRALYFCTTTGTTSTAQWTVLAPAPGSVTQTSLAVGAAPLPYVAAQTADNLHMATDGSNPTLTSPVTAGRVRDDSDATNLQLAATIYKRLDTGWAAGGATTPGNGGCDTSTKGADQTWHAYLIGKLGMTVTQYARTSNVATLTIIAHGLGVGTTARVNGVASGFNGLFAITAITTDTISYASTGSNVATTAAGGSAVCDAFDTLFSQSYNSPTMPSGWTVKQCLGSILTDGSSNIRAFTQIGDFFRYKTPVLNISGQTIGTTKTNLTLAIPNGVSVNVLTNIVAGVNDYYLYVFNPDDTDFSGSAGSNPLSQIRATGGAFTPGQVTVYSNTSQQITAHGGPSGASNQLSVAVLGWRDPRRRMF